MQQLARVIPEKRVSFIGDKGSALNFEASTRLSRLPALDALVSFGNAKFVHTSLPDGSCETKSRLTGFPMDQILSIAFFDYVPKDGGETRKYGVIRLASDKLDAKSLSKAGLTKSQAKRARKSEELPEGMRGGTCSPVMSEEAAKQIDGIVIASEIDPKKIVDISIGGTDEIAHEYSVQLEFGALMNIIKQQGIVIYS